MAYRPGGIEMLTHAEENQIEEEEKSMASDSRDLAGRQIINDGTEFPTYNEADKPSDDKIYSTYTATIGLKREYSRESLNMDISASRAESVESERRVVSWNFRRGDEEQKNFKPPEANND